VLGTVTRREDGVFFWMYLLMGLVGVAFIVLLLVSRRRDRHLARSPD
jgi:hypothetical protein